MSGPLAYYTMGEPAGATQANDSSGNNYPALQQAGTGAAVTFGTATGPGTDDMTAASFAGGKVLQAQLPTPMAIGDTWIECFFSTTGSSAAYLIDTDDSGFSLALTGGGKLLGVLSWAADLESAVSVNDGNTHHALLQVESGGPSTLYLDGVAVDSDATAVTANPFSILSVGGQAASPSTAVFTGTIAHVATGAGVLDPARVLDHADAGLTGFAGETTDERLVRYAGWANIPAAEVVTTTSAITLDHIDSTGAQVVEMMRKVEAAEAGVLHDDREGNLVLEPRSARYNAPVAVTLDASSGQVGVDYAPKVDRSALYTIGEGQNIDGTVTARYVDQADRAEYGDSTYSVTTAAQNDDEPLYLAAWVVNANSAPRPRAPQVTVNLMPYVTAGTAAPLVALDIGSKVRISNAPSQAPATTADYFVEGYSETIGASVWSLTLNLSPAYPYDDVLILDSATDGLLDAGILAL